MRKIIVGVFLLMAVHGVVLAQGTKERRAWGYAFSGVGGSSSGSVLFQAGGGGEGLFYKGLGMGAEVGYVAPFQNTSNGFGILSTDVVYHFRRTSKLVPFVEGGYSLAFRDSAGSSGVNFGGGVHYWMNDHVGLRFEVRDHVLSSDSPQLFQARIGLSFR